MCRIGLLMVAATLVAMLACTGAAAGAEWHVYPGEGTPIQDVVDGVEAGDTIYVHVGTYVENVAVDVERLTLVGDGANLVTVNAADTDDHVFDVTADRVNISGFTVMGAAGWSPHTGIYLNSTNHCSIYDNTVISNRCGICLYYSSDNTLTGNTASSNDDCGICLYYSSENMLTGNTFVNDGLFICGSYHNNVENNTVNGKPLVYLEDATNYTITSAGQVILVNCNNITAENLELSSTIVGIELWETDNSVIANNTVSSNIGGICLHHSSGNALTDNTVNSNIGGICLHGSDNNRLTGNTASSNDYGIYLDSSSDNRVHHNNLIDNAAHNAYSDRTNAWNSTTAGNYYSDYTGTDNNTDGIGDDPYSIPGGGGSVDNYPLMQPWTGGTQQLGDLNGDNQITPADAAIALAIAASGGWDADADVSGDNCVTSLDALMILQECIV